MATITDRVLSYQRVGTGLDTLVQSVSELVYRYPVGRAGFTEDDSADFLLRFYPRIRRLIRNYRPAGSTFESYLNASLRWQLRSFAAERATAKIRLRTAVDPNISTEIQGHEPAAKPSPIGSRRDGDEVSETLGSGGLPGLPGLSRPPKARRAKRPAHRPSALRLTPGGPPKTRLSPGQAQRFLCVSLKASDRLDAPLCRAIARVVGCSPDWLEDRWLELREETYGNQTRQKRFRTQRDHAWFRLRCIEAKILSALPAERDALYEERRRWQGHFERATARLDRAVHGPTHLQIAEVLGIPKGTVDSGIFKARHELLDPEYRQRLATLLEAP